MSLPSDIARRKRDEKIDAAKREYATAREGLAADYQARIDDAWTEYRREMDRNLNKAIAA